MKRITLAAWWLAVAILAANTLKAEGYRTTLGTAPDDFPVVVVSGTPSEMGLALGTLMKPEIQIFAPRFLAAAQEAKHDACSSAAFVGSFFKIHGAFSSTYLFARSANAMISRNAELYSPCS